jgi:C-terminal processing protease CtpA/Prc
MLIDEMSGSGGDAFPAMMQGLGRAMLFGSRTMGAGGHVLEMAALPYSGNSLRMTKSLFFRPDGTAVENNGVVPEVGYTITRDDFLYGYRNYQATYLAKLLSLIP